MRKCISENEMVSVERVVNAYVFTDALAPLLSFHHFISLPIKLPIVKILKMVGKDDN